MNEYLENQLNKSVVYQQLKDNCERNNQHEVLALVAKVGTFAVERLKTVIKNMPEFTLHDDTHIFNMLTIIGKLIPQENMRKLSTPDLFMLIVSVFLHDIGMAPDEKHILAWKNQLPETEYDEVLKEEREKFARLKEKFSLPSLTITDIKENVKRTCDSIVNVLTKNFFLQMSDNDFRARSHMELNGIYLQRIEGRQRANQMFVDSFMQEHCFSDLKTEFAYLEKRWLDIRLNLYKSYFDEEERKDDLELVNSEIKDVLRKEMDLWSRIESSIK